MESSNKVIEKTPLLSVITVCLNRAHTIERCVESILEQDYPNIEYIIQDGGSTDGTVEILQQYENQGKISLVSEVDSGAIDACFRALKRCQGEFILMCHSDDRMLPKAVSWGVKNLLHYTDAAAIYGDNYWTDLEGNIQKINPGVEWNYVGFLCREFYPNWTSCFWRKSCLEKIAPKITIDDHDEYELFMYLGRSYNLYYCPGQIVSEFAIHEGTKWLKASHMLSLIPGYTRAIETFLKDPETPESVKALRQEIYGGLYLSIANHIALFCNDTDEALTVLQKGLKYKPKLEVVQNTVKNVYLNLVESEETTKFIETLKEIQLSGFDIHPHHCLALESYMQHNMKESLKLLLKELRLHPLYLPSIKLLIRSIISLFMMTITESLNFK